ncbi:MAG: DUF4129 domain-containing protein [Thermoplasmata archaeon]
MPEPRGAPRSTAVLLVVVAFALAVGAAASLIAGAATAPAFHSGPIPGLFLSENQLALLFVVGLVVFVGIAIWVYTDSRHAIPGRAAVGVIAIILVIVLFIALFHVLASSGVLNTTTPTNSTGTPPPNNTSTGVNNTSRGNVSTPGATLGLPQTPPWLPFAGIAVAALVAVAVLFPLLWRRSEMASRGPRVNPVDVSHAQGAFEAAARELDAGAEPRQVVIRLYATLLERVAPIVGGVDRDTPEEIRVQYLVHLGIRADAASTLTRLFEEARYSSHPMGPDAAASAQEAILQARSDLDQPGSWS